MPRCRQYQSICFWTSKQAMAGWSIPVNSAVMGGRALLGLGRVGGGGGLIGLLLAEHLVADPVGDGLLGVKEPVAFGVLADALDRLPGAAGHDPVEVVLGLEDVL